MKRYDFMAELHDIKTRKLKHLLKMKKFSCATDGWKEHNVRWTQTEALTLDHQTK